MENDAGDTFDYVIVGSGAAGSVLANRLTEQPGVTVCVLEAGPPDSNLWIHIPLGFSRTYVDSAVNWKFESAPQPTLDNRRLYLPQDWADEQRWVGIEQPRGRRLRTDRSPFAPMHAWSGSMRIRR